MCHGISKLVYSNENIVKFTCFELGLWNVTKCVRTHVLNVNIYNTFGTRVVPIMLFEYNNNVSGFYVLLCPTNSTYYYKDCNLWPACIADLTPPPSRKRLLVNSNPWPRTPKTFVLTVRPRRSPKCNNNIAFKNNRLPRSWYVRVGYVSTSITLNSYILFGIRVPVIKSLVNFFWGGRTVFGWPTRIIIIAIRWWLRVIKHRREIDFQEIICILKNAPSLEKSCQ